VLAPLAVDHVEDDVAFQLAHRALAGDGLDLGFSSAEGAFGVLDQGVEQFLPSHAVRLRAGAQHWAVIDPDGPSA
jgi:hypothetical protein